MTLYRHNRGVNKLDRETEIGALATWADRGN